MIGGAEMEGNEIDNTDMLNADMSALEVDSSGLKHQNYDDVM